MDRVESVLGIKICMVFEFKLVFNKINVKSRHNQYSNQGIIKKATKVALCDLSQLRL